MRTVFSYSEGLEVVENHVAVTLLGEGENLTVIEESLVRPFSSF